MKILLIIYAKESAGQVEEDLKRATMPLDVSRVRMACISNDNVADILKRLRGDEVEKLYIYGDQINDGVLKLAIAAFVAGIPVTRRAFRWRLQPVCKGCEWRQNAGNQFRGTGNTCCAYSLETGKGRIAPPLRDWCPYLKPKKKEKGT
ncbi:MAG: hypothetical protein IJT41_11595 [Clostridia bacterium]|nr:hypothetical protein [Clostridia bacterium]